MKLQNLWNRIRAAFDRPSPKPQPAKIVVAIFEGRTIDDRLFRTLVPLSGDLRLDDLIEWKIIIERAETIMRRECPALIKSPIGIVGFVEMEELTEI